MSQGRSIYKELFKNFINSLKPRKYWGELKGKDSLGTEYYEAPSSRGRKRPSRWFSSVGDNFDVEIPPEWHAWLRHKRKDPPTKEEIEFNVSKMMNTIQNAQKLEMKKEKTVNDSKSLDSKSKFPKYEEYESDSGKFLTKKTKNLI